MLVQAKSIPVQLVLWDNIPALRFVRVRHHVWLVGALTLGAICLARSEPETLLLAVFG
jgi:hypothetical protein